MVSVLAAILLSGSLTAPQDALTFGARSGVVLNFVKADKGEQFEAVLADLRRALNETDNPVRRQQGEGWRFFKAAEPGPGNSLVYVFLVDPVLRGADYSVKAVFEDARSEDEARRAVERFTDSLAAPQSVFNVSVVAEGQAPAADPRRKKSPQR